MINRKEKRKLKQWDWTDIVLVVGTFAPLLVAAEFIIYDIYISKINYVGWAVPLICLSAGFVLGTRLMRYFLFRWMKQSKMIIIKKEDNKDYVYFTQVIENDK